MEKCWFCFLGSKRRNEIKRTVFFSVICYIYVCIIVTKSEDFTLHKKLFLSIVLCQYFFLARSTKNTRVLSMQFYTSIAGGTFFTDGYTKAVRLVRNNAHRLFRLFLSQRNSLQGTPARVPRLVPVYHCTKFFAPPFN